MRQKNARRWQQPKANRFNTSQNLTAKILGATAVLSLFAVLLIALFSPQTTHITHAQQRSEDAVSPYAAPVYSNDVKKSDKDVQLDAVIINEPQTTNAGGEACTWAAGPVYPITIFDHVAVGIGNSSYSFGGSNNTAAIANAYKFDGTAWTAIAPLPVALQRPAVVTDGTSAFLVGGIGGTPATATTALNRYNPATNDYTALAPASTAVWAHSAAYLNGKIYKIGGFTTGQGVPTNVVEAYDIASNTWTTVAPYPEALGWTSAFTLGNRIYVAGGTGAAASAKTYRYDPATNTWDDAAIADLPAARWGSASAVYDNGLIMAGGVVAGAPTNTVVKWNPATNSWVDYPNLLQPRFRLSGAAFGDSFYAIGGSQTAFVGTNDHQKLTCPVTTAPVLINTITYVSENGTPANNTPDPGETVTVSLSLENVGSSSTGANTTVTLQASGGIVPVTTSQNYGAIAVGATVTRNFTFTVPANAICGSQVTLTFNIQEGSNTSTVTRTYTLGTRVATFSENFDSVTPPALPTGWTQTNTGSNTGWVTSTTNPDSAPNSAFNPMFATPGGADLTSPTINVTSGGGILNFRLRFLTEATYDGAILEVKIGSGEFQEFTVAGGTFTAGAYNSTTRGTGNPLGTTARPAWSGNSNGYINVSATLPAAANGQAVQFRWRTGHDDLVSPAGAGINIDNVQFLGAFQCSTVGGPAAPTNSRADFDGDGRTDVSVFRNGTWFAQRSTAGFIGVNWGAAGDQLAPGDYNGDNKTDFAIYRPTATAGTADFYVLFSDTNTFAGVEWGTTGDIVKVGDYDGNNRDDYAVYRPSTNQWLILTNPASTFITYTVGAAGNTPVQLDFDGDGRTDPAAWVPASGLWTIRRSSDGTTVSFNWGTTGDIPVPADYLGNDNRDEVVVFRAGQWLVRLDNGQLVVINWGAATDIPVPGDYDGDGTDDQGVYRGGTWFVRGSTSNVTTTFGAAGDIPVPRAYTPNN